MDINTIQAKITRAIEHMVEGLDHSKNGRITPALMHANNGQKLVDQLNDLAENPDADGDTYTFDADDDVIAFMMNYIIATHNGYMDAKEQNQAAQMEAYDKLLDLAKSFMYLAGYDVRIDVSS